MLYTYEKGSPETPAIVFLHGGGLTSRMWQPVIERLPEFHCLAPDLPEHGQSINLAPFDLDDAARLVIEVIRAHTPGKKAYLVGLSLGGAVALNIARIEPDTADRIMVSGTSATLGKFMGTLALSSLWMLRYSKPETLVKQSVKQWGIPEKYLPLFSDDLIHSVGVDFNRTLIETLMEQQLPENLTSALLVTVGEKETIPAKQAALKLKHLYSSAIGCVIPGMQHVWALQNPDLFAATVRAWVTNLPLPDSFVPFA